MNAHPGQAWHDANMTYLCSALKEATRRVNLLAQEGEVIERGCGPISGRAGDDPPPALEVLASIFGLSEFEKNLLLLCAGLELDAAFAKSCAALNGGLRAPVITFELASRILPDAHWSALSPGNPLRRWRMVEVDQRESIVVSPLRIDERILFYLVGVAHLDQRLDGLIHPYEETVDLAPSQTAVVKHVLEAMAGGDIPPYRTVLQLCGRDQGARTAVAAAAARALDLRFWRLAAADIPETGPELSALARLVDRELALSLGAVYIDCGERPEAAMERRAARLADAVNGWTFIGVPEALNLQLRDSVRFDVAAPTESERHQIWAASFAGEPDVDADAIRRLAAQFEMDTGGIRAVRATVSLPEARNGPGGFDHVWQACRVQARRSLEGLAERVDCRATWQDLVLPEVQTNSLREICAHVRHARKVFQDWGFARKSDRGQGVAALFAGPSGTGKTLAAEILANDLSLDLYKIDLSQVVSKYIGETEKNLGRIFDAAQSSGAILMFDEADALFGKRSEVRDSHDRYANIEVSYLLQKMEAYRGLAILTTNLKSALDPAFVRRLRFIVRFPFPDTGLRTAIWERVFPAGTPTDGLDLARLARLNVTGGHIRNIALNAAFLAARDGGAVSMKHVYVAARSEYAKLEKPPTAAEFGGRP